MFGLRSNPHARAEALVKHAHSVWDKADVELRTLLLRNVKDFEDDRLFLAYVHAPWAQLPDDFRLHLTRVIVVYEDTPGVLKGMTCSPKSAHNRIRNRILEEGRRCRRASIRRRR